MPPPGRPPARAKKRGRRHPGNPKKVNGEFVGRGKNRFEVSSKRKRDPLFSICQCTILTGKRGILSGNHSNFLEFQYCADKRFAEHGFELRRYEMLVSSVSIPLRNSLAQAPMRANFYRHNTETKITDTDYLAQAFI